MFTVSECSGFVEERETVLFDKNQEIIAVAIYRIWELRLGVKVDQSPAAKESLFQMIHARLHSARYIVRKAGTAVWLSLMILPSAASSENRLAEEKSPYLLQHKDNPVDWYPWGKEAFDRARQENKPVFVSIGYSTCHWCHVMARESFENPQTAKLLNEHFVNVKVDREERPDVDRFCMAFVQATSGSGGWPMNVWMTPEGEPFFGGTYFPPDDRPGQPGFPSVIRRVAEEWKSSEVEIRAHGGKVIDALRSSAAPPASEAIRRHPALRVRRIRPQLRSGMGRLWNRGTIPASQRI